MIFKSYGMLSFPGLILISSTLSSILVILSGTMILELKLMVTNACELIFLIYAVNFAPVLFYVTFAPDVVVLIEV